MAILKSKLIAVLEEQKAQSIADIRGDMVKAEWGQQIRNYVFHPYKMVKVRVFVFDHLHDVIHIIMNVQLTLIE